MKNKQIVLHQYYRLKEVVIMSTDIYYTPIDKVSGEVWCGKAQQKTLDVYKETEAMGYDLQISEDYVNVAVWNKADTRVLTDMNGICSIIDSIYASGFHFLMSGVYFSFFMNTIQSRYPCRCLVLIPCFCLIRFFASACSSFTDDTVFPCSVQ